MVVLCASRRAFESILESWRLVRKSRLRMAYIGAETPNDALLKSIRKGTRSEQTMAATEMCRRNGVIPELSFMVAPPEIPKGKPSGRLISSGRSSA